MSRAISSLYDSALQAVLRDLSAHVAEFPYLPSGVKTSLARVMAKRGALTDKNIKLVSWSLSCHLAMILTHTRRCFMMGF